MSKIQLESQIDKWFKSMHEYKEEMRRRYHETIGTYQHDLKIRK